MVKMDTTLQDAKALLKSARKYAPREDAPGVGVRLADALAGAIETAAAADITQRNAVRETGRLTEAQDRAMKEACDQIRKVRFAGKACYKKAEQQALKEFKVGSNLPQTAKGIITELGYLRGVAQKRMGELAAAGFRAADLADVDKALSGVEAADLTQELAKKTQKASTQARDKAYDALREAMRQVRAAAKSVFIRRPEVLVEFESTARAKAGKAKAKPALAVEKSDRQAAGGN